MNALDKRVVIAGGTGQIGEIVQRWWGSRGAQITVLTRNPDARPAHPATRIVVWDGATLGTWTEAIDGAEIVLNLAGRSVDCRYTAANLEAMLRSRVDSTRAIGAAVERADAPPALWLQMSTATIYAHAEPGADEGAHDEANGTIGGREPDVPAYWQRSVEIAVAWERALAESTLPKTRRVALRTAMVMSPDRGGVFDVLYKLTRRGLGGRMGSGEQYVSWIHGVDFCRALDHLVDRPLEGPVNLAAPEPLPQRAFQAALRQAAGRRVGLPAARWMLEIGAFFMRTDTELLLKSRRVVPGRLLDDGFRFAFDAWPDAARDLACAHQRPVPNTPPLDATRP